MTRAEHEIRRFQAIADLRIMAVEDVMRKYQVRRTTVWRWQQAAAKGRVVYKRITGRPPRLNQAQREQVKQYVLTNGHVLTYAGVVREIEARFGVRYNPSYIWRLLASMGIRRAIR